MNDSQALSPSTDIGSTYQGFGEKTDADKYVIDYNFFSKDDFELLSFNICDDKWGENNANYLSDHNAICSTVKLRYVPIDALSTK